MNIESMMQRRDYIRNVSIIAHVDHGKTALTESLTHVHMDVGEEKERGITIKSAAVSLQLTRPEQCREVQERKSIERTYLINLIDSPGHVDFSSEVTSALRITDGAICVIDCIEGVCVQTETVLRQAIREKVKPVLFLNKVDRIWLEKHLPLDDTYKLFKRTVESTNAIIDTYTNNDDDVLGDLSLDPSKNNVAFGSGYFGWGFTLSDFADLYTSRWGLSSKKMRRKLWNNHHFDAKAKKWTKLSQSDSATDASRLNGFCEFVLKPLQVLHDAIMAEDTDTYLPIVRGLGLNITSQEWAACSAPKDVLRMVMSKWLPAKRSVLDLCADSLPSPVEAQRYRIPSLYTGPLDSGPAQDMRACDPNGVLSVYISKMIPIAKDPGRFIAFGRVFSGTVRRGQELRILGPGEKGKAGLKKVQGIRMMMGAKERSLAECAAGNVVGLLGIDKALHKSGSLGDDETVFPFKTMKFSVSPVVKVAVAPVQVSQLNKLLEGLRRLEQYDQIVKVRNTAQQQLIVAGTGELHLQTCLRHLREDLKNVEIRTTNPIVSFCEGVGARSGADQSYPEVVCSKSANKLNRVFVTVEPLSEAVCAAIESDELQLQPKAMKAFGREMAARFPDAWTKEDASRIWSFGCADNARANVLVDCTKSVDYLDKVRASLIQGFIEATAEGVLCGEPLRGVRVNLMDAKVHSDPAHRGAGQFVPAMKKALRAGVLAATPTLLEPVYAVDIEVPSDALNGVYSTLGKVRGEFQSLEDRSEVGIPLCKVSAFVPILETLKDAQRKRAGFTELLRDNTKGKAFPVMRFSHWQRVQGDPIKDGSVANGFALETRARKQIQPVAVMPRFADYHDKV